MERWVEQSSEARAKRVVEGALRAVPVMMSLKMARPGSVVAATRQYLLPLLLPLKHGWNMARTVNEACLVWRREETLTE